MAKGFKHGAGGTSLNFKVVGNPQPADPKENTVWVDTDAKITSWAFQTEQPENVSEGSVWLNIDIASTRNFNALKKNAVQVYPVSAKQYISGEWVNKTAKIYKDGTWLDFSDGYLYKRGTWYNGTALDEFFTHGTPTLKYNDNAIRVTLDSYEMTYRAFQNKEDFTGKTKLSAKFYSYNNYTGVDSSDNAAGIRMMAATAKNHSNSVAMAKIQNLSKNTAYNLELDVSKISGEYYVLFLFNRNNSGTLDVDLQEVRLQ